MRFQIFNNAIFQNFEVLGVDMQGDGAVQQLVTVADQLNQIKSNVDKNVKQ